MNFILESRMRYSTGGATVEPSFLLRKFQWRVALWLWIGPVSLAILMTLFVVPGNSPTIWIGLPFAWCCIAGIVRIVQICEEPPTNSVLADQSDVLPSEQLSVLRKEFPQNEFWVSAQPGRNATTLRHRIYLYQGLIETLSFEELELVTKMLSDPIYELRLRRVAIASLIGLGFAVGTWSCGGDLFIRLGMQTSPAKGVAMVFGFNSWLVIQFSTDVFMCNQSFKRDAQFVETKEDAELLISAIEKSIPNAERVTQSLSSERIRRIKARAEGLAS